MRKSHESAEDYLETILVLRDRLGMVRSIDIVKEMGFTKPSVSIAMKNLREKTYIVMDTEGYITFTSQGEEIAKNIYERHLLISRALVSIGVSEKTAQKDACRIEHDISTETFDKIKESLENN